MTPDVWFLIGLACPMVAGLLALYGWFRARWERQQDDRLAQMRARLGPPLFLGGLYDQMVDEQVFRAHARAEGLERLRQAEEYRQLEALWALPEAVER